MNRVNKPNLLIVGSGIKTMSHMTMEVEANVVQADAVLYLVNEPVLERWILKNCPTAESLQFYYGKKGNRIDSYRDISDVIVSRLEKEKTLCVIYYGHPLFLAWSTVDAATRAKALGYRVSVLPGISSIDCLFSDLCIDPSVGGYAVYDATEFLFRRKSCDPSAHLILFQVGSVGNMTHEPSNTSQEDMEALTKYLQQFYSGAHEITLYEAAIYPHFEPLLKYFPLSDLSKQQFSCLSTLYIPPLVVSD